jgi:nucleotide-binding universal stress UspA family protein
MYNKVLVPLDGSKTAEVALPHARALAYSEGAEIILLRVAVNPALEFSLSDPAIAQKIVKDSERESRQYIGSVATQLKASGFEVSMVLAVGAAAEAILKTAEEIHADVIAMSTHGRTGPARWLLGSVADRVVRNSNVPVMLIRAQS